VRGDIAAAIRRRAAGTRARRARYRAVVLSTDVIATAAYATLVVTLLGTAEALRRAFGIRAELLRKLGHVGSGLAVLAAPACFSTPVPLLVLSALFAALLFPAARLNLLPATHATRQPTNGSAYFAVAVFLLTLLFWRAHVGAFLAGVLVLTLGDGLAGVVGELAGRHRYTIGPNTRSLEGSLTMFAVSTLGLAVLFLAGGDLGTVHALAHALILAAVVTLVEALSPGGTDNLSVPLTAAVATLLAPSGGTRPW
jgi:phytol kinase